MQVQRDEIVDLRQDFGPIDLACDIRRRCAVRDSHSRTRYCRMSVVLSGLDVRGLRLRQVHDLNTIAISANKF